MTAPVLVPFVTEESLTESDEVEDAENDEEFNEYEDEYYISKPQRSNTAQKVPVTQQKNTLTVGGTAQPKTKMKNLVLPGPAEPYSQQFITGRRETWRKFCAELCELKTRKDPKVLVGFVADWKKQLWPTAATMKKESN